MKHYVCFYVDLRIHVDTKTLFRVSEDLFPNCRSMVVSEMTDLLHVQFGHLLSRLNQPWLTPADLVEFSQSIYRKGAALDNCWGFIDGTVRPVSRPGEHQRVLYNGHKRVHAIKFQSVVAPNGLIANLFGPVKGRRHDSGMLALSGLLPMLEAHCVSPTGQPLCVYGDLAYPLRVNTAAATI